MFVNEFNSVSKYTYLVYFIFVKLRKSVYRRGPMFSFTLLFRQLSLIFTQV